MRNFRNVGNDILRDWLNFREEDICSIKCKEDKKHTIGFEEVTQNILNNVSGNNMEYVKSQLEKLDEDVLDYMHYWFEKYYRNGFCDAMELLSGCLGNGGVEDDE